MAIVLKVTPEELNKAAGEIETQIKDIENQFAGVDTEISRTRSYWEGEASDSHKAQYDALKDEINEAVNRLKNHPVNLLRMAGIYQETETNVTEAAESLPQDVIV